MNTSGADCWLSVTLNGDDPEDALLWQVPVRAGHVFSDSVWTVLSPGDDLRIVAESADALTVTCSGAQLGAPA